MGRVVNWSFDYELYVPVRDPFGPPKYEPPDFSRYIAVLPEVIRRVENISQYLTEGAKTPFVADRPGTAELGEMGGMIRGLTKRLDAIESKLGAKGA